MDTQRHVIKRQIVEITLAKKENAWQLQQTLSRILNQHLPPLLDRCLSEASSPDCLHRIDRLELDLGELDSNRLEVELLERIDATLRQALSEQIGQMQFLPVAKQQSDPVQAHIELFEYFVREGCLPWWADSSQRHTPEKSLAVLLNNAPNDLKRSLVGLIPEPRSLQRLISYFDDSRLVAMMALLNSAPKDMATSLLQTLLAVQVPLRQHSLMPIAQLRATLWQSLLQVAITGEPVISRHGEFLTAVTVRGAKLQGLSHKVLVSCLQQLLSNQAVINNEWLQAVSLSMQVEHASTTFAEEVVSNRYALLSQSRFTQSKPTINSFSVGQTAGPVSDSTVYRRQFALASISNRHAILNKLRLAQPKPAKELSVASQPANPVSDSTAYRRQFALASISNRNAISNKLRPRQPKPVNESSITGQAAAPVSEPLTYRQRLASVVISNRYVMLKRSRGASPEQAQKHANEPLAGDIATKQSAHKLAHFSLLSRSSEKNNRSPEGQGMIETTSDGPAFSDTDAVYINNAGLCILWPFLATFFERMELVQDGRFHNQAAKQCAVSLLHYLAAEELDPPEYLLPLNKLLCAMEHNEVFDFDTPLTILQIKACDELLGAVIDNAPVLNNMSVNGFRGSFLLRRGSLGASEGSWLLRVERETYDLVLERFPWSWQWFKLPWMEHPLRVEW